MFDQRGQQVGNQYNESKNKKGTYEGTFPIKWDEMVNKPRLQQLIDNWRERAAWIYALDTVSGSSENRVYIRCANELQEVLDNSGDPSSQG